MARSSLSCHCQWSELSHFPSYLRNLKAGISPAQGRELMNRVGRMSHSWLLGLARKNRAATAEPVRQSKRNHRVQLQQRKTETISSHFTPLKLPVSPSFPCGYYGFGTNTARWRDTSYFCYSWRIYYLSPFDFSMSWEWVDVKIYSQITHQERLVMIRSDSAAWTEPYDFTQYDLHNPLFLVVHNLGTVEWQNYHVRCSNG